MIIKADEQGEKLIKDVMSKGMRAGAFGPADLNGLILLIQSIEPLKEKLEDKLKY